MRIHMLPYWNNNLSFAILKHAYICSFSVNSINMLAGNLKGLYALPSYKPCIIYSVGIFNLLGT